MGVHRYFTTPFMMLVLHMKPPYQAQLYLTMANYVVVNAITLYVFLFLTIIGSDAAVSRFMW